MGLEVAEWGLITVVLVVLVGKFKSFRSNIRAAPSARSSALEGALFHITAPSTLGMATQVSSHSDFFHKSGDISALNKITSHPK